MKRKTAKRRMEAGAIEKRLRRVGRAIADLTVMEVMAVAAWLYDRLPDDEGFSSEELGWALSNLGGEWSSKKKTPDISKLEQEARDAWLDDLT